MHSENVLDAHVVLIHMWMGTVAYTQMHVDSLQAVTLCSVLFLFAERTSHGGYKPLARFKLEPECSCVLES